MTRMLGWLGGAALLCAMAGAAKAEAAAPRIVLAAGATADEATAAQELATYFGKMTGVAYRVVAEADAGRLGEAAWVGPTAVARAAGVDCAALAPEEWVLRPCGRGLIVAGGRPRGTLYAACHLLEDCFGVRWWTPWEETVPRRARLVLPRVTAHGRPAFRYRDIYIIEGDGAGPFCARNRLNRNGDAGLPPDYGGAMDYGPPYHVHTFYMYVPPEQSFDAHPEYFSEIGGKRMKGQYQLCTSNPGLRALMLEKLRAYIAESRAAAAKAGAPPPLVYDISQNDWGGFCECPDCKAFAEREGGYAGPYLDLLNYLADGIRADYPDVCLDTLAYFQTQKPPKTVRARDSVIVRLCDTGSNFARPITAPENRAFRDLVAAWAKVARHLRIWDYAVTYGPYSVLPFASAQTYGPDFRFYLAHNVEGVFTEHEFGVIGDMRDLKLWMMMKLLEDPRGDYAALLRDFTNGYYGAAGPAIRRYLADLQAAQERAHSFVGMGGAPANFLHLDAAFLARALAALDRAEKAVAGDPTLLERVRHARLSLDRATVVLYRNLVRGWAGPGPLPLNREAIAAREKTTWLREIDLRVPPGRGEAEKAAAEAEIAGLLAARVSVPLPEQFRGLPAGSVWDYTSEDFRNWQDIAKVVPDAEAECGVADRLELTDADMERYRLPMPWGVYDVPRARSAGQGAIRPEDVPGPGYHWYRLAPGPIGGGHYVWFFWSWIIQCDVAPKGAPGDKYQVWARVKFEGPGFPGGGAAQKDAICVERVVVARSARPGTH